MKIQCDVCNKDEASVFCSADEAALCDACDRRVHHANKLAGKHQRFSLLHPSPKHLPLCDVCKEKRAFLFCQEDRAILCRDCDVPIHKANEHTQKHNRFLLTGAKLSPTSSLYSSSPSSSAAAASLAHGCEGVPNFEPQISTHNSISSLPVIPDENSKTSTRIGSRIEAETGQTDTNSVYLSNEGSSGSANCITEHLIDMIPGWQVEDFLDSSFPHGFCKSINNEVSPIWDSDVRSNMGSVSLENIGIWVPRASVRQTQVSSDVSFGFKQSKDPTNIKPTRKPRDDCFPTVPQISSSNATKKSRTFLN